MTSHGEWFKDTKDLKTPGFEETSDDTTHPITKIGKVPLSMQNGQTKYLKDVPTITKNLVSIGQMVEQGLHVTFNPNGCFVEDMKKQGKLIAKGKRNGRMFTLDVNMPKVNSMLFTHGKGAGNIGIGHKRVGHVNLQRLKLMEKQNLVRGLPKFGIEEVMSEVCEACQLGK
jgi:ribosomal protein L15